MKKRVLSLLLAAVLVLSALPYIPAFAGTAWDGSTKSEPAKQDGVYQIGSGDELAWFAEETKTNANISAVLTDDIDLGNKQWEPIGLPASGYITEAFAGTFDGQGHTVSNLYIDTGSAFYGLFYVVYGGTVKNLKVVGDITTSGSSAGGIVGKLQGGTVENCSFDGSVKAAKNYTGGIVGNIVSNKKVPSSIIGCCNFGAISGAYAGGILGYTTAKATISGCYNTGDISGTKREAGIVGQQTAGAISYCYNIGSSAYGIYGFSNAAVTNCYYLNDSQAPLGTAAPTNFEQITDANKAELLSNLNAGEQKFFVEDKANINGGFPVFEWQSSAAAPVPVAKVSIIGDAVTGASLTAQAVGMNGEEATNVQYQWAISQDNESFTDIADAAKGTFTVPDTADYAGKYIKVTVTGEETSTGFAVIGPIEKSDALTEKENTEKVQKAIESISLDTVVIKSATTLDLPEKIGECSVKWTSSNTELISDEGVVTLPDKNIVTVTLTATVTCGTVTQSKVFTVDVWSKNIDAEIYLQTVLDAMEWNFKALQPVYGEDSNIIVKFQNLLKSKGFDGVTVTVKSTDDESLVSENGKIFYPVNTENSFADGKQVQVFFNLSVGGETVVYPTADIYSLLIPWDTSDVKNALESSADTALTESVICGENDSFDSVSSDLSLPSCIKGDKYSFAWITWESSDEKYLAVSDENRQSGADSLYNPYVGKVYRDSAEHTVTLTATVTNPSTNITATRTFEVVIKPYSDEELSQSLGAMQAILDCYTEDKLKNFATKKQLDVNAVDSDIQLVIPKNVVTADELATLNYGEYWDYWNYKFTVSSSDTDVIEINSFRAFVYRPLGEDSSADRQVTLTVKMESKANPNLFVTKDITVTVKHLSREDINSALDLMDQAKFGYANGLLGNNADTYSVIDDLKPFFEIVWNADKSGVEFVYRNADVKNNGIIVDTLPGWEEQEDWRLFRTSDKDLIANETLVLNKTPDKDTFVKISSVLTDETLGKYYIKFQDDENYDVEALAKFKQLYKQPVNAYVMAVGSGNYTKDFAVMPVALKASAYSAKLSAYKTEIDKPISVTFTVLGADGKPMVAKTTETSFTKGATVFDVFKKVMADNDMSYVARGSYIYSINGLSERDYGNKSGWMYTVDKVFVNSCMNAQELSGGEDIVVMYVKNSLLANVQPDNPDDGSDDNQGGNDNNNNDNNNDNSGNNKPSTGNNSDNKKPGIGNNAGSNKPNTGNNSGNKKPNSNSNSGSKKPSAGNNSDGKRPNTGNNQNSQGANNQGGGNQQNNTVNLTNGGGSNNTPSNVNSNSSVSNNTADNKATQIANQAAENADKNNEAAAVNANASTPTTEVSGNTDVAGANANTPAAEDSAEKKSIVPTVIGVVAAVILVALTVILLILEKRRKRM